MGELAERLRPVSVGAVEVPSLDPVDGLLYLCLHGSLSGGHQLVWLKDLEMMLDRQAVDWDLVVDRARRWRADLVAAMQLDRARAVLGARVPDAVVETLAGGSAWWRWWRRSERRLGYRRWGGYDHTGRTWWPPPRPPRRPACRQLARSVRDDVVSPALAEHRPLAGPAAVDRVPELYRPVGGPDARAAYQRMAVATGWDGPAADRP